MPPRESIHWLDVDEIGYRLSEKHPDIDPLGIPFPKLKQLVQQLEGFQEQAGHPCNEKILEAIQQAWMGEREEDD
jgi:FeS assembly protein IscX